MKKLPWKQRLCRWFRHFGWIATWDNTRLARDGYWECYCENCGEVLMRFDLPEEDAPVANEAVEATPFYMAELEPDVDKLR